MKHLPSSYFLRIGRFLGQLLVRRKNLFGMKTFTEELLFEAVTSIQDQGSQDSYFFIKGTSSKNEVFFPNSYFFFSRGTFWKHLIFQQSNIPQHLRFQTSSFFGTAAFSKKLLFQSSFFFRGGTFEQLHFLSTAILITFQLVHWLG